MVIGEKCVDNHRDGHIGVVTEKDISGYIQNHVNPTIREWMQWES